MKVLMRTTAHGKEYWDTDEKRTLFVPKGKDPDFEVTKNPESMLQEETEVTHKTGTEHTPDSLDDMDAEQLLAFAEDNDIQVPGNMKKEDTIRNHIAKENLIITDDQ